MKFPLILAAVLPFVAAGCVTTQKIAGSGTEKIESRSVGKIESVVADGNIQVVVTNLPAGSLAVRTDDNLLTNVETKVHDETLTIKLVCNECELVPTSQIVVEVSGADLEKVSLTEQAGVSASGLKRDDLEIVAKDKAKISLSGITVDELTLKLSDKVEATISGTAASVEIDTEDSVRINASDLVVKKAELNASDDALVSLDVQDLLEAKMTDSAKLTLKREPTRSETKVEDSAAINRAY